MKTKIKIKKIQFRIRFLDNRILTDFQVIFNKNES